MKTKKLINFNQPYQANKLDENFFYEYEKRKHNKKQHFTIIVILIIILSGILSYVTNVDQTFFELYFLEINLFTNYIEANNLSQILKKQNAGGYIYYDGNYHVFANVYLDENSTKKVVENIVDDYSTSKVFSLKILKNSNIFIKNERNSYDFYNNFKNLLQNLNSLSLELDKEKIDINRFSTAVSQEKIHINSICNDMKNYINNLEIFNKYMQDISICFEQILNSKNISEVRYNLIDLSLNIYFVLSLL